MNEYAALSCHLSGNCNTNVIEILKLLRRRLGSQADLRDINVLYLSNRNGNSIFAHATTGATGRKEWRYHVVLEHNGHIIDPDFASANRRTPVREYFARMFPSEHYPANDLTVQSIPATDYLNEFGRRDPLGNQVYDDYYRKSPVALKRYPPKAFNEKDPAASILPHAHPQPLRVAGQHGLLRQGNSLWMREGGTLVYFSPGRREMQTRGVANPELERKFLAEFQEEAKRNPEVKAIWEYHRGNLADSRTPSVPAGPPARAFDQVVRKASGSAKFLPVENRAAVALHDVSMSEEDFILAVQEFARSRPDITEYRLNIGEVFGYGAFKSARKQGLSKVEAMKRNALYRALEKLGFRAENLSENEISDYEPFLTMKKEK